MKLFRIIPLVVCLLAAPSVSRASENYDLFRFDLGLLGTWAPGDPGGYGGGLAFEPMFNIFDFWSLGVRVEGVGFAGGSVDSTNTDFKFRGLGSVLAKTEVLFFTSMVRPFVGFALGGYYSSDVEVEATTAGGATGTDGSWHFGVAPQAGVNIGFLRLALAYHVVFGDNDINIGAISDSLSYNYLAFEVGFIFGGGKKDNK